MKYPTKITLISVVCAAVLSLDACAAESAPDWQSSAYQGREVLGQALLNDQKDALLSEEAIQRLLSSRVEMPTSLKLAIVNLGHHSTFSAQESLNLRAIEKKLSDSGHFDEITHVPSLLIGNEPSLIKIREAAALMQADVVLAYRSRSRILHDRYMFSKDEVRGSASVEVLIIDIKTAVVPYANTLEDVYSETERESDRDTNQVFERVEQKVTLKVLDTASTKIKQFFDEKQKSRVAKTRPPQETEEKS